MASASRSVDLTNNKGAKFPLSVSFSESWTDSLLAANKTRITVSASLKSTSQNWSSNYTSWLRVYWYDDNGNTSSNVPKASASASSIALGGTISASTSFDVTHKANGTLNGYVYATWTQGSSSGGYCPNNGSVRAPASGTTALQTIAVKPSYNSISATEITSSTVRLKASIETHGKSITDGGWDITTDPNKASWSYESGGVTDKTLTGLQANTTYYYRGYCVTSAGGSNSSWASFTTAKPAKPTVTSVTTNSIDEDNFNIVINASAALQAFISTVYVSIDNGSTWLSNTADILGNNWNISGLQIDTQYNVKVKVKDNFNTESDITSLTVRTSKHKIMRLITPTGRTMTPVSVFYDNTHKDLDDPDIKVVN